MPVPVQWSSPAPTTCDTCDTPIKNIFYDAKTDGGPWACMCPSCFMLGPGIGRLGLGLGQKFEKTADGVFFKTGG